MRNLVHGKRPSGLGRCVSVRAVLTLPIFGALAGCSADVVRLDSSPSFSLNDPPGATSTVLRPAASMARSGVGAHSIDVPSASEQAYTPSPRSADRGIEVAALPEPPPATPYAEARPSASPPASAPSAAYAPAERKPAPVQAPAVKQLTSEKGDAVEVQQGDTLYGLSKKHKVSLSELMQVNSLSSPNLKPGQTIYLPKSAKKPLVRQEVAEAAPAAAVSPELAAKYSGSYTVQKGDSLYALALKMKVPLAELQQVNGISDVRRVKPGAVLKVPGSAVAATATAGPGAPITAAPAQAAAPPKVPAAVVANETASGGAAPSALAAKPVLLNGEKQVAAIDPKPVATVTDASTESATAPAPSVPSSTAGKQAAVGGTAAGAGGDMKLRWPVRGKIIAGYGARPDGTHNDGVNVQVPQGADVHAAEAGVVAYAGSELKGYGNLVLVRHDNGWITAYAHNSEIVAKRGDRVKRGQVIAKAGKSGQVDQPQVHFELRQGSKPVDPTPFMEKL